MTDTEIIQKVLDKIYKNGYPSILGRKTKFGSFFRDMWDHTIIEHGYYRLIFDPKFAKALWGEELLCYICKEPKSKGHSIICSKRGYCTKSDLISWQYYQLEMLREIQKGKNPLKYLEKFLDK